MQDTMKGLASAGVGETDAMAVQAVGVSLDDLLALIDQYRGKFVDPTAAINDLVALASNFSWPGLFFFIRRHGDELWKDVRVAQQFSADLMALLRPHVQAEARRS